MAKLPYVTREDLDPDKKHVFDRIVGTRGKVLHIFQAILNSPDAAEAVSAVGEYLRYKCPLDPVVRETAILATAQELNNEYEWTQHVPVARTVGVREEVIDAIRSGKAPMGIPAKEGVFAQAAKELIRNGKLSNHTFQAIEHLLGPGQTIDLIVLVGYYSLLSGLIKSLDVELEEDVELDLDM